MHLMVSLKFKAQQMSVENPLHSTNLHRQQSKLTLANDPNESIDPSSLSLPRSCADQRGSIIKMGPDLSRMIIESLVDGQRIFTDLSESQI